MNIFDGLDKKLKESEKRWDEIIKLEEQLKGALTEHGEIENSTRITAQIVLLLIEQLKPLYSAESVKKEMQGVLDMFAGGK